ncbi:MAG: LCP family protein [Anaerolineales bacterium]|nr:LCP family protein [Anaerolineales bacterium]
MTLKKFNFKRPTTGQIIAWGVGLVLAIAVSVFLSGLIACWRLTSLPGLPLPSCAVDGSSAAEGTPEVNAEGTPIASDTEPTVSAPIVLPEPWDGGSRVSVLFIGLDYRDWLEGQGPPRSDTMIVLTIDPLSRTAGMLSIPRDLWVTIPGFGYGKINTAYSLGEAYNVPGGGPGLAMRTVENVIGVPVQYYAQVDFSTFSDIVGTIGGVEIYVEEEMSIDIEGPGNTIYLEPGWHHFDGSQTLAYARARNTEGGDVDRARRQQQVIMALRDKILDPASFPNYISWAPLLYDQFSSGIHTNLDLDDALRLAVLAQQIDLADIHRGIIGYEEVLLDSVVVDGVSQSVFQPIPDNIRVLRDEIFGSGALSPTMANGDQTQLMQDEGARVVFVNGTLTANLAGDTGNYFTAQGMNVTAVGNTGDYPENYYFYTSPFPNGTVLIIHSGAPYTIRYLMTVMNLGPNALVFDFNPNAPADIVVGIGNDWVIP